MMESGGIKLVYLYVCENELFEKIEINFMLFRTLNDASFFTLNSAVSV